MATKNKKLVKKPKIETVFSGNQVMTILESVNDGIEILAENQNGLREEFGEFKKEFKEFKKETRNNFREVFDCLDEITLELKEIKKDIERLDQDKIERFEYVDLLKRVKKLEQEVKEQKTKKAKC